jgi:hypothetical protein
MDWKHILIMSSKLVICSDESRIMTVFKRDLKLKEILRIFAHVEVPDCEDKDVFDMEFKNSVKKVLTSKGMKK